MGIVAAIVLFVCGALAASSLVIAKKPNAKELLDKLVPFQGWIGFVVCLWSVDRHPRPDKRRGDQRGSVTVGNHA